MNARANRKRRRRAQRRQLAYLERKALVLMGEALGNMLLGTRALLSSCTAEELERAAAEDEQRCEAIVRRADALRAKHRDHMRALRRRLA